MQMLWTNMENILMLYYPYSIAGGGNMVVPTDVIQAIYSKTFIDELDLLGITHKSAIDWSATYLKP